MAVLMKLIAYTIAQVVLFIAVVRLFRLAQPPEEKVEQERASRVKDFEEDDSDVYSRQMSGTRLKPITLVQSPSKKKVANG